MGYDEETYNKIVACAKEGRIKEWNAEYCAKLNSLPGGFKQYSECDDDEKEAYFPQLDGADFRGMNLRGIFLYGASLKGARFDPTFTYEGCICTHLDKAMLNYTQLEGATLEYVYLEGAILERAVLENSSLVGAHLENAVLRGTNMRNIKQGAQTHFENAEMIETDLSNSSFSDVYLNGTRIIDANLKGTTFYLACTDGSTLITGKQDTLFDDETSFLGTSLSQIRIRPELRVVLEKNIRRKYWEDWYSQFRVFKYPARLFWWLSDYGTTCRPCIAAFIGFTLGMFVIYSLLTPSSLAFSPELLGNTILATFGIGDPGLHGLGRLLIAFQAICGYFLLAVLITRFAVMFQSLSP